jgi:hypothetical protein
MTFVPKFLNINNLCVLLIIAAFAEIPGVIEEEESKLM